jgi:hypothetical protein
MQVAVRRQDLKIERAVAALFKPLLACSETTIVVLIIAIRVLTASVPVSTLGVSD